jgi:ribosomal peptide maturation radical SAM protein 1
MTAPSKKPIALVSAPTLAVHFPSFQLALLAPTLRKAGFEVEPLSLFMEFGKMAGWKLNDALSNVYPSMVGEWIWSKAAFGEVASEAEYVKLFESNLDSICREAGCTLKELRAVRNQKTFEFLDWAMETIDWSQYSVVGFTVVFQQMVASLALARRIRERYPEVPIVFGGATFEDDIASEIIKQCDWVDAVHCGDADLTIADVMRRLANKLPLEGLPGLMFRNKEGKATYSGRAPNLENLDLTPVPDFDEYFNVRQASGYDDEPDAREVMIPFETARGCWYGMKNHCTFCGLNRSGMDFRAKSAPQVLEHLQALSRRYGVLHFNAIDNILAPEYVKELFGKLAEGKTDIKLHYEIRPSMSHEQLRLMKLGGLISVQPGVESFSTHVLTLMKKFTTGMKNVELLKWTTYYGITNLYNILYGFAGETADDYRAQAKVMRQIFHVQPPWSMSIARPDRGSPMFEQPGKHGITKLTPSRCYDFIYPKAFDLRKASYFFEDERDEVPDPAAWDDCLDTVAEWRDRWTRGPKPTLTYVKGWQTLTIHDRRNGTPKAYRFDDRTAQLYELCADAKRREDLLVKFDGDAAFLDTALEELIEKGVMLELDDKVLALALPDNPNH